MANTLNIGPVGDIQELSANGRLLIERREDGLTREERASDGTLRRDVIARKKAWTLSYELADQSTVDRIEELADLDEPLTMELTQLSTTKNYTVLFPQSFESERLLAVHGGLWAGLSIEIREV